MIQELELAVTSVDPWVALLDAVTKQRLVKVLQLFVVTSYKHSINPITNPPAMSGH
jgi:hypothetical protein